MNRSKNVEAFKHSVDWLRKMVKELATAKILAPWSKRRASVAGRLITAQLRTISPEVSIRIPAVKLV